MSPSFANGSSSLPQHCKAAVCVNPGPNFQLELRHDRAVPRPGKGQLLLKLSATGLCSSDYHFMRDDWGFGNKEGIDVVGHEGAGVVVALGPDVDPKEWKIGDRAGVKPYYSTCGKCKLCKTGYEPHCPDAVAYGAAANGSYSQYCLTFADYTTRIPDGLPDHIAAPILCSGATTYAAIKKSGVRPGQWLVIPGSGGGVGSMAVQYAKAMGIRVLAIDGGEKEEMCNSLGAEAFIDFKTCKDIKAEVERITDGGAHAILVTGGSRSAYADTHLMLRTGGTMVCVGMPPAGEAIAGGDPNMLIMKGITITGSLVAGSVDVDEALDMAARGQVKFANIHLHKFEEWPSLITKLGAGQIVGRAVVSFE